MIRESIGNKMIITEKPKHTRFGKSASGGIPLGERFDQVKLPKL